MCGKFYKIAYKVSPFKLNARRANYVIVHVTIHATIHMKCS